MRAWRKQTRQLLHIAVLSVLVVAALVPTVHAAQSNSTHFQVNEVQFGNGGELQACSTSYCAKQSVGETAVGNTASNAYQAQAGFNSDREPSLTFIVPNQLIDFGVLTPGTFAHGNATFSVYSYLTSGYVVQTVGSTPTYQTHSINPMTTAALPNTNLEQFGMNLAANTDPATFGALPSQAPDASFGFGTAAAGYDTADKYQYNDGDVIAQSLKSTGTTNYTISYILNTTAVTPAGTYKMNQILVATSTY